MIMRVHCRARAIVHRAILTAGLALASTPAGSAAVLPAILTPSAPFPHVVAANIEREFIAPGIARVTYHLFTARGPFNVFVVVIDPRESTVRLETVLAHDRLVGVGETVAAMAQRTGAVAGINADYFDIGNTFQPLGIVIAHGELQRSPSTRPALIFTRERAIRFATFRFGGSARTRRQQIPIAHFNEFPPQGGASLMTPAFGPLAPTLAVTALALEPLGATTSGEKIFRITAIESGTFGPPPPLRLVLDAHILRAPLTIGETIALRAGTDPDSSGILTAIGGGTVLLAGGKPVDDPRSPGYAERASRIPIAAAATLADGRLALVTIDGRHPRVSIGASRAEAVALLQALGATDALLFDSGGSTTLVGRVLGDARASVLNSPSDDVERPVANGLFVYSDAPSDGARQLVIRPSVLQGVRGVAIPLSGAFADGAGHALGRASGPWHLAVPSSLATLTDDGVVHLGMHAGTGNLRVEQDGVIADIPLRVMGTVSQLTIEPDRPNPDAGAVIALHARGVDASRRSIAIGDTVRWTTRGGTIDARGSFTAGDRDAIVTATLGATIARTHVRVGRHLAALDLFGLRSSHTWRFSTIPAGQPGGLVHGIGPDGSLRIAYDFRDRERAVYASAEPARTLGEAFAIGLTIAGDGSGVALRAAVSDRFGVQATLALAPRIDWIGDRASSVPIPTWLAPPIALRAFYVTAGTQLRRPRGAITIRAVRVLVPGSGTHAP